MGGWLIDPLVCRNPSNVVVVMDYGGQAQQGRGCYNCEFAFEFLFLEMAVEIRFVMREMGLCVRDLDLWLGFGVCGSVRINNTGCRYSGCVVVVAAGHGLASVCSTAETTCDRLTTSECHSC